MKGQVIFWSLFISTAILSIFLWLNIQTINDFYDPYSYLTTLIILVLDLALFSVLMFLFDKPYVFLTALILPFSFLGVFGINKYLVISSIISILAIFIAIKLMNLNKERSIKLIFLSVSHQSTKWLNLAFIILIVGLPYSYLSTVNSLSVPKVLFDKILGYSKPIITQSIGFSNFDLSIDDFLAHQILGVDKTPINLSKFSPGLIEKFTKLGILSGQKIDLGSIKDEKLLEEFKVELVKNIKVTRSQEINESRLGISKSFDLKGLKGNESASSVLYDIINNYTIRFSSMYSNYIPSGVVGLGLIFSWGIFKVFSLISGLIGLSLISLLKLFKLVKIDSVDIKKEIIAI